MAFQRCSWAFQRLGLLGLLVFVACGAAGLLGGHGIWSGWKQADGPLTAKWDRVVRVNAPADLVIELPPGESSFLVARPFFDAIRIEAIRPAPTGMHAEAGRIRLSFDAAGAYVELAYRPRTPGRLAFDLESGPHRIHGGSISLP